MKTLKLRLRPRPRPVASLELRDDATCLACGRPSAWNRRWASDWDAVLYCAGRCQATAKQGRGT